MKIKCLIVDDEPLSQDIIKKYIDECPMLELSDICFDAFEANNLLQNNNIQLIFLDINMPKISGIQFVKSLNNPPLVIFTTAYPEHAIEGFEVDAVDYLLKPFSFDRFLKAVNKASEKINNASQKPDRSDDFILLKSDKKLFKVCYNDINYLQSYGDYIKVYTCEKCIIVHDTFKNILDKLPPHEFLRVHKSFIISLSKIKYIDGNQVNIANELIPIGLKNKDTLLNSLRKK